MSMLLAFPVAVVAVVGLLVLCCVAMAGRADRETNRCGRERAGWNGVEAAHGKDGQ
jgi:hypothetical protein